MGNSNDRRVRKTKAVIRRSLTELLRTKELNDISVSELTKLSDISRGTFYLHYKNVFDLFEQTEDELVEDVGTILFSHRSDREWLSIPTLIDLFRYIASNAEVFVAMLRVKETEFFKKLTTQFKPQTQEEWRMLIPDAEESTFEYCYTFIASGCAALMKHWFESGMQETPEAIADFARRLVDSLLAAASSMKKPI